MQNDSMQLNWAPSPHKESNQQNTRNKIQKLTQSKANSTRLSGQTLK